MPALFIILILLVGYAANTGTYFQQGADFLFKADFSKLSTDAVLTAMGHAFFTLSLGMGAIMIYGAYLPNNASITTMSFIIAFADTCVALLAGLAIFPLVFANDLAVNAGPGLIFHTLPLAFGHMDNGTFYGGLFFTLLVFAAWSSAISLIEPATAWLVENKKMSRRRSAVIVGFITWLLGLLSVFSFNIGSGWTLFGLTLFEQLDYLTANIMLPLGGFLIAIFAGWFMSKDSTMEELNLPKPLFYLWLGVIRFISPLAIIIVLLYVLGIISPGAE